MEVHEFKIKRKVLTDEVFTVGVDAESRDEAIKLLKGIINNTEEDLANQLYNNMYAKEDRIYVYDAEAVQSTLNIGLTSNTILFHQSKLRRNYSVSSILTSLCTFTIHSLGSP